MRCRGDSDCVMLRTGRNSSGGPSMGGPGFHLPGSESRLILLHNGPYWLQATII